MLIVAVEGIVGAGKSTLATRLEKVINSRGKAKALLVPEPTQEDTSWLRLYYEDQVRWAFHTQIAMLTSRHRVAQWAQKSSGIADIILLDRSVIGDKMFAEANHRIGNMNSHELNLYSVIYSTLVGDANSSPIGCVIDVQASVDQASESILERNRDGEPHGISRAYLTLLDECLKAVLQDLSCPVLSVPRLPFGEAYDLRLEHLAGQLEHLALRD